jgi:hypothetical protein
MPGKAATGVIEYRVEVPGEPPTEWKHGRTVAGWVVEDREALSEQRGCTRDAVREWGEAGRGDTVRTRVLAYDEDGERV